MDLRIFTEPQQGGTYDDLLRVAKATEELGFDGFFRSDHFLYMGAIARPGLTDAWTTLAGLARETSRIALGTLVTSATFRLPGPLAVTVAQVDQMSGGRIELGLGAGWYEAEHRAFGIPFPDIHERFDRLEEQLAVIAGIWSTTDRSSFTGENYSLENTPATARTAREIPIIIGGSGKRRTPELAAKYATEFNANFVAPAGAAELFGRVAAVSGNRKLINSVAQVVCVGRTEEEFARRAAMTGRDPVELRRSCIAGSPGEVVERIHEYAAAGASRLYLQVLDLGDLDHLELISAEVAPQLTALS
jgi:F420-dependent oxidoreductase-like protein